MQMSKSLGCVANLVWPKLWLAEDSCVLQSNMTTLSHTLHYIPIRRRDIPTHRIGFQQGVPFQDLAPCHEGGM